MFHSKLDIFFLAFACLIACNNSSFSIYKHGSWAQNMRVFTALTSVLEGGVFEKEFTAGFGFGACIVESREEFFFSSSKSLSAFRRQDLSGEALSHVPCCKLGSSSLASMVSQPFNRCPSFPQPWQKSSSFTYLNRIHIGFPATTTLMPL